MGLIYYDIPELGGSDTEIALTNLSALEDEIKSLIERRLAYLCELACSVIKDGGDPDTVKSIILSIKSDGEFENDDVIEENRHAVDHVYSRLSPAERIFLFKEVFEKLAPDRRSVIKMLGLEKDAAVDAEASERVAYLQNSYTDTVYMEFSALLNAPRASYFGSISDVCESVYNGVCEYCILPIETQENGKLPSFYELILKYGFKINAVYDLVRNDSYTRYALLGKRLNLYKPAVRSKVRNRYFELIVSDADNNSIGDILSAADFCSLKLTRVDTVRARADKLAQENYYCSVFRADGADLVTFLAFLTVDCPDFIPLGYYMQI